MDPNRAIADPGKGVIDFGRIFRASQKLGIQLYTVEQDNAGEQAIKVAENSYPFLRKLRY